MGLRSRLTVAVELWQMLRHLLLLEPIFAIIFIVELCLLGQTIAAASAFFADYVIPVLFLSAFTNSADHKWYAILLFPITTSRMAWKKFKDEKCKVVENERQQEQEQEQQQQQGEEEEAGDHEEGDVVVVAEEVEGDSSELFGWVQLLQINLSAIVNFIITLILMTLDVLALPWQKETNWENGHGTSINFVGNFVTIIGTLGNIICIAWNVHSNVKNFSRFEKVLIVFPSALFRIFSLALLVSYLCFFSLVPVIILALARSSLFICSSSMPSMREKVGNFLLSWIYPLSDNQSSSKVKHFLLREIFYTDLILMILNLFSFAIVVATGYHYNANIIIGHQKYLWGIVLLSLLGVMPIVGSILILRSCKCENWLTVHTTKKARNGWKIAISLVYYAVLLGVAITLTLLPSNSTYVVVENVHGQDTVILKTMQANNIRPELGTSANISHSCSKIGELNGTIFIHDSARVHHLDTDCFKNLDEILELLKQNEIPLAALMVVDRTGMYRPSSPPLSKFKQFSFPISFIRPVDATLAHSLHGRAEVMTFGEVRAMYGNSNCIKCLYNDAECPGLLRSKSCMKADYYLNLLRKMIDESWEVLEDHGTLCPYENNYCSKINATIEEVHKGLSNFTAQLVELKNTEKKPLKKILLKFHNSPFTLKMVNHLISETSYYLSLLKQNTSIFTEKQFHFFTVQNQDTRFPWLKLRIPYDPNYHQCTKDWNRGDNSTVLTCHSLNQPNVNMEMIREFIMHSQELDRYSGDIHMVDFYPRTKTDDATSIQYCTSIEVCNEIQLLTPLELKARSSDHLITILELNTSLNLKYQKIEIVFETTYGWKSVHLFYLPDIKCTQEGILRIRYHKLGDDGKIEGVSFSSWTMMMRDAGNATCTSATMDTKYFRCEQTCHWENDYGFSVTFDWSMLDSSNANTTWVSNLGEEVFCNPGNGSYTCQQHPTMDDGYCQLNCDPGNVPTGITVAMVSDVTAMKSLATSICTTAKALVFFENHTEEVTAVGKVQEWGPKLPAKLIKKQPFWVQGVLRLCGYLTSDLSFKRPVCYQYFPKLKQWKQAFTASEDIPLGFANRPVAGLDTHYAQVNKLIDGEWEVTWYEYSQFSLYWQKSKAMDPLYGKAHGCLLSLGHGKLLTSVQETNGTNVFGIVDTGMHNITTSASFPSNLQEQDIEVQLCSYLNDKSTVGFLAKNSRTNQVMLIQVTDYYESDDVRFSTYAIEVSSNVVAMELVGEKIFIFGSSQLYEIRRVGSSWKANRMKITYLLQSSGAETVVLVPHNL